MPTRDFPAASTTPRRARAFVVSQVSGRVGDRMCETIALLVSELTTNALLHANSGCRVTVTIDGDRVRVEVRDHSKGAPVPRRHTTNEVTGRGLLLVERLADAWGFDVEDDGKVVWFEVVSDAVPGVARG